MISREDGGPDGAEGTAPDAADNLGTAESRRADRERSFSRRAVLKAGGWSVPVVLSFAMPREGVQGSKPPHGDVNGHDDHNDVPGSHVDLSAGHQDENFDHTDEPLAHEDSGPPDVHIDASFGHEDFGLHTDENVHDDSAPHTDTHADTPHTDT